MKPLERTQQQMDPALTLDSRIATIALAGMALAWSVGLTILTIAAMGEWEPRLWALALLATATFVVARETAPLRAPFTAQAHLAVHVLACTAYLLNTIGREGSADSPWLPWIPIALTLLIVAMCRYRPPREILGAGLLSASGIALATMPLITAPVTLHGAPGGALLLTAVLPVITASVAAACYSRVLVSNSERWKAQAGHSSAALEPALLSDIERVMYHERVNALSGEAFPFLRRVLDTDPQRAVDLLEQSTDAPDNLGEGRHPAVSTAERDVILGEALARLGRLEDARAAWSRAVAGPGALAVEDGPVKPAEYWRGVAHLRLGNVEAAERVWKDLAAAADELETEKPRVDYFATSLPELLLFDTDTDANWKARIATLRALAASGRGLSTEAVSA